MEKNKLPKRYIDELNELSLKSSRFNVSLGLPKNGVDLSSSEISKICRTIIPALCSASDAGYLYGQERNEIFERFSSNVEKARGKYQLKLDKDIVTGYEDFWGVSRNGRGTIMLSARMGDTQLSELLELTQDPGFVSNLGSIASTSAIRSAKKIVSLDSERVCFLLSSNQGLNKVFVFAHTDRIEKCLALAIEKCSYTDRFLNLYGS